MKTWIDKTRLLVIQQDNSFLSLKQCNDSLTDQGVKNQNLESRLLVRVALVVPACQPGWEEMENLRGNLRKLKEI